MADMETHARLYRAMLRIRIAEEKIVELYPTDKIQSPIHLSIGQEAVSAGLCLALGAEDRLYGTYRGHGPYLARGGDLGRMFAELYGRDAGCARGKGGSMHLLAPEVGLMGCSAIVSSTIPVAVGDALASRLQGLKRVTAALFGDGGVDEGVFFESANFAALKGLPVLFVLENNRYAIHSRVADRHKQTELWRIAEGVGLRGRSFDGNDAATVYETALEAVRSIRAGGPPLLVEYTTHRWREHVGPGSDWREAYRHEAEEAEARGRDPLKAAEAALAAQGVPRARLEEWRRENEAEVRAAVEFAERSPIPRPERLLADVYAEEGA